MPEKLTTKELQDLWSIMSVEDRVDAFKQLPQIQADEFFDELRTHEQAELLLHLPQHLRRHWIRTLPPDDIADLLQELDEDDRAPMLHLLDKSSRDEVRALLVYAEDAAGGLMNPRFVMLRPEMNVEEAIRYIRIQARTTAETIYYVYVIDAERRLQGVVTLRELLMAARNATIADIMVTDVATVPEDMDQEEVSRYFHRTGYMAMPVVDDEGRIKGIITFDDIVDVVTEEATEDIHKLGGSESLGAPYNEVGVWGMVAKRAGWLALLFFGAMLTATAMESFEDAIERVVVLALFVPLIISSGGNSGSQAATLVVRAMGLNEVTLRDWFWVMRRELATGLILGLILGVLGLLRVIGWEWMFGVYGEDFFAISMVVGISLVGIVAWGTLIGSMLPFILRRLGFDPASSSAPFVATIVDVTGIIIYFSVANLLLAELA